MMKTENFYRSISELARLLANQNDTAEVTQLAVEKTIAIFEAETASIYMVNPRTHETIKTVFHQQQHPINSKNKMLHVSVAGWIMNNDKPFISTSISDDPRIHDLQKKELGSISVIGMPLETEGITIGTIACTISAIPDEKGEELATMLRLIADIIAPHLRNIQDLADLFAKKHPIPDNVILKKYKTVGLIGKSASFINLLRTIERAAEMDLRVLIEGETGTGKELIAKAIHKFSQRSDKPFIAIDCGTLDSEVIESELFGHKKGAFTGATSENPGLFKSADGGTLFLDEIANLPPKIQSKLMRVLEVGEIRPVGGNTILTVDVRVIVAGSVSLKEMVDQGTFRQDLFYRLHTFPIQVPSLSERSDDIPELAHFFLRQFAEKYDKILDRFHPTTLKFMKSSTWEGNIRELRNFVERLVAFTPADQSIANINVLPENLLPEDYIEEIDEPVLDDDLSFSDKVDAFERDILLRVLEETKWNQSEAARRLKITEQTVRYKVKKLNITRP